MSNHDSTTTAEADLYRHLLETGSLVAGVGDFDGRFMLCTGGWRDTLGYVAERLIGTQYLALVHPGDAERVLLQLGELMASSRETPEFDVRLRCKDGSYRWMVWTLRSDVALRRIYGIGRDITERRLLDETLRSSEERLRSIAAQVPGCLYEMELLPGGERRYTFVSERLCELFGVEAEELHAHPDALQDVIHVEDRDRMAQSIARAAATLETCEFELRAYSRDGRVKQIHGRAQPRKESDGRIVFSGILIDRTEAYLKEQELIRAREAALDASRAKSLFLANMSHEIRTPMNGILGMTSLALTTPLTPDQQEYLTTIQQAGESLLAVFDDILDLSKLEARRVSIARERFALRELVEDVAAVAKTRARDKGLEFRVSVAPDAGDWVVGDPLRLGQILRNLLANAVKFTEVGSVTLSVTRDESIVSFTVSDSGTGVPLAQQERVFEPFQQGDDSATRRHGGTGLGLSISRELAELMNGRLWMDSEPGAGSTFQCDVPLPRVDEAPVATASAPRDDPHPRPLNLNVLVAEDNPVNVRVAVRMLEKLGCTVQVAANGRRAVEMFDPATVDLVLIDVQMPEMDGLEATRQLREAERARNVRRRPIIALTANAMMGDQQRCLQAGMDGYLAKPITLDSLQREIRRCLANAE